MRRAEVAGAASELRIVLGQITDTSVVGIFLGGFIPAAVSALCLMAVILVQADKDGLPGAILGAASLQL